MKDFGFYLVMTNPLVGYAKCCEAAVRAGVRMVQLRMKDVPRGELLREAKLLASIVKGSRTRLIVDDDASVAAEAGADGVHVGQDDMSVAEVRAKYPEIGIVGLSTHNPAQARAAIPQRPDYIGVGPVFATPTKKIPDPVLGVATAGEMIASVPFPAVAIGGINGDNLGEVIAAGARNWAVVRAVCASRDPYSAILSLMEAADRAASRVRRVSRREDAARPKRICYPFTEECVRSLRAGDLVLVSGTVFTGRDRFHKHFAEGGDLCADFREGALYHCGPVVTGDAERGWKVVAAGPTTSARENPYEPDFIAKSGVRVIIGKGGMDGRTLAAMKKHGCVYVQAVGGAGALAAACVKKVSGVSHLADFGAAEACWRFEMEDFAGVVAMDSHGRSLFAEVEESSRRRIFLV